jgi:hypothetical protein
MTKKISILKRPARDWRSARRDWRRWLSGTKAGIENRVLLDSELILDDKYSYSHSHSHSHSIWYGSMNIGWKCSVCAGQVAIVQMINEAPQSRDVFWHTYGKFGFHPPCCP